MGSLFSELYSRHGGDKGVDISPAIKKWALRLIGPVILLILLFQFDISKILEVLRQASIIPIVLAYLMFIPSLFFRTVRWRLLMAPQGIHLGFSESLNIYSLSIFLGVVTPGRFGEFIKALYLKQKGNTLGASFFSVVLDRVYDILFLLIFGCGALSWFAMFGEETATVITWTFFAIALGAFMLWVMTRDTGKEVMVRALKAVCPKALKDRIASGYLDFSAGFGKMKPATLLWAFFFTILAWGSNYGAVYLFGIALGFHITFFAIAGIAAVCALVTLIPISVMGLGTRDAAVILMLGKYGVAESDAMAFSTLILSMLLFNAGLCAYSLLTPVGKFERSLNGLQASKKPSDDY